MKKNLKKILSGVLAFALAVQPLTINAADYMTDASVFEAEPLDITTEEVPEAESEVENAFTDGEETPETPESAESADSAENTEPQSELDDFSADETEEVSFDDGEVEDIEIPAAGEDTTVVDSGTWGNNVSWSLDSAGTMRISVVDTNSIGEMDDCAYKKNTPWEDKKSLINALVVEKGITKIGQSNFSHCDNLSEVKLPSTLIHIGNTAFSSCENMRDFFLPNSLEFIGDGAFSNCDSLEKMVIPTEITSIGVNTFFNCDALTSIVFSDNIMTIKGEACGACGNLTSVVLPKSLVSIGNSAFWECDSLTDVYYIGLEDEWKEVVIERGNDCITNAKIHYNSNGMTSDILSFVDEYYNCKVGESIPMTAVYISENEPTDIKWECSNAEAVTFSGTSTQGPSETGKDNTWWISVMVTGVIQGTYDLTIMNENGTSATTKLIVEKTGEYLELLDFLAFSDIAYSDFSNNHIGKSIEDILKMAWDKGWDKQWKDTEFLNKEIFDGIALWKLESIFENRSHGYYAVAFSKGEEVVIAYRGSTQFLEILNAFVGDFDGFNDWILNDLPMQVLDISTQQLDDAISTYQQVAQAYDTSHITVTGHSLGGGLADAVSAYSGCRGVSLNAICMLDPVYYYRTELMGNDFIGVDKWNFIDHANRFDFLAGRYESGPVKRIKPYISHNSNYAATNILAHHGLKSIVSKDEFGNVIINKVHEEYSNGNGISNLMTFGGWLDLGYSGKDNFSHLTAIVAPTVSYGGAGEDTIKGGNLNDVIIGGKDNDQLDGLWGNDKYVYYKGDGCDTIHDISGKDVLNLNGFSEYDIITTSEDGEFFYVLCNGELIVKISKKRQKSSEFEIKRENLPINSFKVNKELVYDSHIVIACPVDVEIVSETGERVFTLHNSEVGNHYTDYGNFYVYKEENGGYGKVLDLVKGYSARIVGQDTGKMDVSYSKVIDTTLSEPSTLKDIPVFEGFIGELDVSSSEVTLDVKVDHNGDGVVTGEDSEHIWDSGTITKKASCTEKGIKTYTCTVCGETKIEDIQALGHDYTYTDNGDGTHKKSCTAGDSTVTEVHTYNQGTCICGATEHEEIGHTHSYGNPVFTWSNDYESATASFTCQGCGLKCSVDAQVTKEEIPPTCGLDGQRTYKAAITFAGISASDVGKTEVLPATGEHQYSEFVTIQAPTAVEEGIKEHTCTVCGETEKVAIEKLTPTVTLNMDVIPLQVKQSTTVFKASGLAAGDKVVSFKSMDESIAVIDKKGKITAKKIGKTKIVVTLASGKTAEAEVKVQKGIVKTAKLHVSDSEITLIKGEKCPLKVSAEPLTTQQKITYQSSNKKVVLVTSKGTILAKGQGRAYVIVKSGSKVAKVKVNVENSWKEMKPVLKHITNYSTGIKVEWEKLRGAVRYYIYRKENTGSWKRVATIKDKDIAYWMDKKVKNGNRYSYRIYATNGKERSKVSNMGYRYYIARNTVTLAKTKSYINIKWKTNSTATGYQVQYAKNSKFSGAKTIKIANRRTASKNLKPSFRGNCYVRVRTYKTVNGVNYYSAWSTTKRITF